MSANLEMVLDATTGKAHANMMHVDNVKPWWGLGYSISDGMTLEEMCDVLQVEDYISVPTFGEIEAGTGIVRLASGMSLIVRPRDSKILGHMSSDYKIHQPRQMFEFFRDFCEAGNMNIHTAGFLNSGRQQWVMAGINKSITLCDGDKMEGNFLLSTSFDGSLSTNGRTTSVCVVCWNTLSAARQGKAKREFAIRHTTEMSAEVIAQAKKAMGLATEQFERTAESADQMSRAKLPELTPLYFAHVLSDGKFLDTIIDLQKTDPKKTRGDLLLDLILDNQQVINDAVPQSVNDLSRVGSAILDSILTSPGSQLDSRKGTAWGLLNGVTHYVDHVQGRQRDTALQSAWFGQGDSLKQDALSLAIELTESLRGGG